MLPATYDNTRSSRSTWEQLCRRFSLADIQLATQNFDDALIIGRGGFGKVYKGDIKDGIGGTMVAAIKRLDSRSKQGAPEFWAEIEMLSKLRHSHLVSLIGYCNEFNEMILVYEFMTHGTLADHLHIVGTRLSWLQRLKICIGAARGLDYLHTGSGTHHGVIHRDVKSSNILLDDNWEAKISDFGLSRVGPTNQPSTLVSTAVKGTFGYLDPEYFSTGSLTRKSDVYAFGVVLLEVLCGRRAVDRSLDEEQWGLVGWAQDCIREGKLDQIIDYSLRGQILLTCLKEFILIAEWCLRSRPRERPTMAAVVVRLESALALQERPYFTGLADSATRARKISYIRKFLKCLIPSIVHGDASGSSKSRENKKGTSNRVNEREISPKILLSEQIEIPSPNLKVFTFADLKNATGNFSRERLVGEGNSGPVYKGWVDEDTYRPSKVGSGMCIAVKKRQPDSHAEWQAEVNFLGQFDHSNIVRLLGYCLEDQNHLLVYEYMVRGSFYTHLFRSYSNPLPWAMRLKIMIGAARGLAFLHTMDKQVIHRNFKSSSILLDGDYNPKLSGFGLATCGPDSDDDKTHVTTRVIGTSGYAAPEYLMTGHLTVKSDVYGFGVVLLEVLTGRCVLDASRPRKERNLVVWCSPFLGDKTKLKGIMDPHLQNEYPLKGAMQAAKLVQLCVKYSAKDRPSMEQVLRTLERISAIEI